jgi:hypothetical protein
MARKLKTPFTRDQIEWLEDLLCSVLTWCKYQSNSHKKLAKRLQDKLDEAKKITRKGGEEDGTRL